MERTNAEDFNDTSNKVGLLFILQLALLLFIAPILSGIGLYNQINIFIFNNLAITIIACLIFSFDFKEMLIRKRDISILEGIFYIFLFFSVYLILTTIINNLFPIIYNVNSEEVDVTLQLFLIGGVAVPIAEEIVYRGILLENLRKFGDIFAVIISALIFGMLHGSRLPHTFLAGLFMGILYIRSNNLIYPIVMHIFNNLFYSSFIFWLEKVLNIDNKNIASLISVVICIFIASILYIILKKKNSKEIENINIANIKEIFKRFKEDKEKYKMFFEVGTVILSLILYFVFLSIEVSMIMSG